MVEIKQGTPIEVQNQKRPLGQRGVEPGEARKKRSREKGPERRKEPFLGLMSLMLFDFFKPSPGNGPNLSGSQSTLICKSTFIQTEENYEGMNFPLSPSHQNENKTKLIEDVYSLASSLRSPSWVREK